MAIKVMVCGAAGRMGRVSCEAIKAAPDMELVHALDQGESLQEALSTHNPDTVVEFTVPDSVFANTQMIIEHGAHPIVGATGLSPSDIATLKTQSDNKKLGGIIAPNFSLGAILLMQAAERIAAYLPHAEIIEMHHDQKVDSPSGTALKTAAMMAKHTASQTPPFGDQTARGETVEGVSIHSVRLPGLFAHQAVMFGGEGETLTLRHDSTDRRAMMPGLLMAIRRAPELNTLVYGLENVLELPDKV